MVQFTKESLIWLSLISVISATTLGLVISSTLPNLASSDIIITHASLKKGADTDALFTVSLKNTGTVEFDYTITILNDITLDTNPPRSFIKYDIVTIPGSDCTVSCDLFFYDWEDSIMPDMTISVANTIPNSAGLTVGSSYIITVEGYDTDDNVIAADSIMVTITRV